MSIGMALAGLAAIGIAARGRDIMAARGRSMDPSAKFYSKHNSERAAREQAAKLSQMDFITYTIEIPSPGRGKKHWEVWYY